MLLVFPTGISVEDDTRTLKSLNKDEFNADLNFLVSSGWEVQEITSKFRKTLFGGVTSYRAELKRGAGCKK